MCVDPRRHVRRLPRILGAGHRQSGRRAADDLVRRGTVPRRVAGQRRAPRGGPRCHRGRLLVPLALRPQRWVSRGRRLDRRGARSAAGRPPPVVDLHPDRPRSARRAEPGRCVFSLLPPEPTFESITDAGGVGRNQRRGPPARRRPVPRERRDPARDRLRDRPRRPPQLSRWRGRARPPAPRRALRCRQRQGSGSRRALGVLARRGWSTPAWGPRRSFPTRRSI